MFEEKRFDLSRNIEKFNDVLMIPNGTKDENIAASLEMTDSHTKIRIKCFIFADGENEIIYNNESYTDPSNYCMEILYIIKTGMIWDDYTSKSICVKNQKSMKLGYEIYDRYNNLCKTNTEMLDNAETGLYKLLPEEMHKKLSVYASRILLDFIENNKSF